MTRSAAGARALSRRPVPNSSGAVVGETDELGFSSIEDPLHVHDLHATLLHLLGMEHTKLTFRFQGRDFRLTDVKGHVMQKLLA